MKLEILKFCFVRYTRFIPVLGIIKSSSIYRRGAPIFELAFIGGGGGGGGVCYV